jgi:hypothetical protein
VGTAGQVLTTSPKDDPLSYPGSIPDESYVLLSGRRRYRLEPRRCRRLGQSWVDLPLTEAGPSCTSLNYLLLRENAAPMDARHPVLAVGSNASPEQLAAKFGLRGVSSVIPVVRAEAHALKVVPSAHMSGPGYVPATPAAAPEADVRSVFVTFLDEDQLHHMDVSEKNYTRVSLDPATHPVLLSTGEQLASYDVYESKHGVINDPRVTSALGMMPGQPELLAGLLRTLPMLEGQGPEAEDLLRALAQEAVTTEEITAQIKTHLSVQPSGLRLLGGTALPYGRASGEFRDPERTGLIVMPSDTATPGESSCATSPATCRRLGLGKHALVSDRSHGFAIVARVVVDRSVEEGCVKLDQTIRNALGVELRERVEVAPVTAAASRRHGVSQRLLGESRYIVARVQTADLATVEQDACALSEIALDLLGVSSGDDVVLEGQADEHGRVRTMRVRAFRAPDDMTGLREQVSGGEMNARFPSAREALGIYPDLPWAFLDARTRDHLGLGKLHPVRIRAERGQQMRKEFRELTLIIAIALLGILTSDLPVAVRLAALVLLPLTIMIVVLVRLRGRLARRPPGS